MPEQIDLSSLVATKNYALTVAPQEHDQERMARLEKSKREHEETIRQSRVLFNSVVSVVIVFLAVSTGAALAFPGDSPQQKFGVSMTTSVVSAAVGFLLGRPKKDG
jgi:putative Mn2+ efflux pump MntP